MSKETDAQYARSVDNVAYARSRCPESKKLCPKCGCEMQSFVKGGITMPTNPKIDRLVCPKCGHEEKVGGDTTKKGKAKPRFRNCRNLVKGQDTGDIDAEVCLAGYRIVESCPSDCRRFLSYEEASSDEE